MIRNLKTFNNLYDEVEGVKSSLSELREEFSTIREDMKELKEFMKGFKEEVSGHTEVMDTLRACREEISQMKGELSNEIYDFKLLKGNLNTKILEKFDVEVRGALDTHLSKLQADADQFRKLKQDLSVTSDKVKEAAGELDKFNRIAQQIKEADFSLVRHAKKLEGMERDKLALMKKVDYLERMVSKARRSKDTKTSQKART